MLSLRLLLRVFVRAVIYVIARLKSNEVLIDDGESQAKRFEIFYIRRDSLRDVSLFLCFVEF